MPLEFLRNSGTEPPCEAIGPLGSYPNWVPMLLEGGPYDPLRIMLMSKKPKQDPLTDFFSGSVHVGTQITMILLKCSRSAIFPLRVQYSPD